MTIVVLLAVEAAVFGLGVAWVLFARSLLHADVEGPGVVVAAALCVAHLWVALALAQHRERPPLVPLVAVLVLQVPIVVCALLAGEPLFFVPALLAAAVLVAGLRTLLVRD